MSAEQKQELEQLVEQTIRTLYEKGIAAIDLAPLVKLHEAVKKLETGPSSVQARPQFAEQPMDEASHASAAGPSFQTPAQAALPAGAQSWSGNGDQGGIYNREGRRGELKASEDLLARASAIIDLLVQSGDSPEHACQVITRQLLSVGIQLPESGGDARAWKRLANWRNTLIHYKRTGPAWDVYCAFKEQLAHIPPEKRIQMAVGERLWERRQLEFSAQNIA